MAISRIEQELQRKFRGFAESAKGRRSPKLTDIFERRYYIGPEDLYVRNYKRPRPLAAFNPAALKRGEELLIFPRLIFDYYKYTSSVGVFSIGIEDAIAGKVNAPLETDIILWPQELWEFLGCEDPRISVVGDNLYVLYTGKGYYWSESTEPERRDALGFAELDSSFAPKRKGYFKIKASHSAEDFVPRSNKDSAFIKIEGESATMLTRPEIRGMRVCWRAEADLRTLTLPMESLEPVLAPEDWELKIGWSTNVVPLSDERYLVGWHGVVKEDWSYKDGLAIVDSKGRLLAISDYLLAPKGLNEEYGDRELVIFGDGLVVHNDHLIWVGGISDYGVGIFIADMKDAMSALRPVR